MNSWWGRRTGASVLALAVVMVGLGATQLRGQPAPPAAAQADQPASVAVVVPPALRTAPVAALPATPRALPVSLGAWHPSAEDSWAVSAAPAGAAPSSSTASVTVRPALGSPLDRFTFVLSGFASNERIVVSFRPPDEAVEILGVPDDAATVVDGDGAGRFELIPAEQWGPTSPGDYTVRFRGEESGALPTVTIAFICGC